MQLQSWSSTQQSSEETTKRDAIYVDENRGLYVVVSDRPEADGTLGSEVLIDRIREQSDRFTGYVRELEVSRGGSEPGAERPVTDWLQELNREMLDRGVSSVDCELLIAAEDRVLVAHVGDCRTYLLRGDRARRLTEESGGALGGAEDVEVETHVVRMQPGDTFTVCSPGVHRSLVDNYLRSSIRTLTSDVLAEQLVNTSAEKAVEPDATALVISASAAIGDYIQEPTTDVTTEKFGKLADMVLFRDLEPHQILELLGIVSEETFDDGDVIIERGSIGDRLFLIIKGQVSLRIGDRELTRLEPGEHFGEFSLFGSKKRSAGAVALGDVALLSVRADQFRTLAEIEQTETGVKMYRNLLGEATERIREMNRRLYEISEADSD